MSRDYSNIIPDASHVSSSYSKSRYDPASGTFRPHEGIDHLCAAAWIDRPYGNRAG